MNQRRRWGRVVTRTVALVLPIAVPAGLVAQPTTMAVFGLDAPQVAWQDGDTLLGLDADGRVVRTDLAGRPLAWNRISNAAELAGGSEGVFVAVEGRVHALHPHDLTENFDVAVRWVVPCDGTPWMWAATEPQVEGANAVVVLMGPRGWVELGVPVVPTIPGRCSVALAPDGSPSRLLLTGLEGDQAHWVEVNATQPSSFRTGQISWTYVEIPHAIPRGSLAVFPARTDAGVVAVAMGDASTTPWQGALPWGRTCATWSQDGTPALCSPLPQELATLLQRPRPQHFEDACVDEAGVWLTKDDAWQGLAPLEDGLVSTGWRVANATVYGVARQQGRCLVWGCLADATAAGTYRVEAWAAATAETVTVQPGLAACPTSPWVDETGFAAITDTGLHVWRGRDWVHVDRQLQVASTAGVGRSGQRLEVDADLAPECGGRGFFVMDVLPSSTQGAPERARVAGPFCGQAARLRPDQRSDGETLGVVLQTFDRDTWSAGIRLTWDGQPASDQGAAAVLAPTVATTTPPPAVLHRHTTRAGVVTVESDPTGLVTIGQAELSLQVRFYGADVVVTTETGVWASSALVPRLLWPVTRAGVTVLERGADGGRPLDWDDQGADWLRPMLLP